MDGFFLRGKSPLWLYFQEPWSRWMENIGASASMGPVLTHKEPGHFLKELKKYKRQSYRLC